MRETGTIFKQFPSNNAKWGWWWWDEDDTRWSVRRKEYISKTENRNLPFFILWFVQLNDKRMENCGKTQKMEHEIAFMFW